MKKTMCILLLLLITICFLSVYSCMVAADSAMAVAQTADASSHTYRYARKHITDISISVPNVKVTFYTQPQQEEIVVQVTGGVIEGKEKEKTVSLYSDTQQTFGVNIYLPERFYNIEICGQSVQIETLDAMHGTMKIQAEDLEVELENYYGGISFAAKEGSVSIEDGNLQKTSTVTLLEQGNIYLHTKITDDTGISSFSTNQGAVKVQTDKLEPETFFEVSAIAVSGEYPSLPVEKKNDETCYKVQIISKNGIAFFEN